MRQPKTPRKPLSKEAKEHLKGKLDRMQGIERKKTIKRLEMDDRGFKYIKDGGRVSDADHGAERE